MLPKAINTLAIPLHFLRQEEESEERAADCSKASRVLAAWKATPRPDPD